MSFLKKLEPLALLLLRCGVALVFIYHGYPKLFGEKERIIDAGKPMACRRTSFTSQERSNSSVALLWHLDSSRLLRVYFCCSTWLRPCGNTILTKASMQSANMNSR